jgi:hypothetical protein
MKIPENLDPNIQPLDLFKIIDETGSIYKAIMVMSKRSNMLSQQMKQEIISRISDFSSYSDSVEEIVENREQIEVSKIYEQMPKPTIIALHEYQKNLIQWKE